PIRRTARSRCRCSIAATRTSGPASTRLHVRSHTWISGDAGGGQPGAGDGEAGDGGGQPPDGGHLCQGVEGWFTFRGRVVLSFPHASLESMFSYDRSCLEQRLGRRGGRRCFCTL
ncbi:unnamed protein product, partial [Ascophyllum nodosum]